MRLLLAKTLKERRLNLAAGALILWAALGPWVWGYATSPAAVASHVFFIFAFAPLTLLIAVLRPAAYVLLGRRAVARLESLAAGLCDQPHRLAQRAGHRNPPHRPRRTRRRDQRRGARPHSPPAPPTHNQPHHHQNRRLALLTPTESQTDYYVV